MTPSIYLILFLSGAAFFAAVVDAIVGGGGLITIPALLAGGIPTHLALGTNKFASALGSLTSLINYYKGNHMNLRLLTMLVPFSFIGSYLGVKVVLAINPTFLNLLIIVLVAVIGVITLVKNDLGLTNNHKGLTVNMTLKGMVFAFAIGFYNGFFGPGTGSFLIFGFIGIFGYDFVKASANAKILNFVGNFTALMLFIVSGNILYQIALPMTLAMLAGSYTGSHMAIKGGAKFIKPIFVLASFSLVIKMVFDLLA